VRLPVLSTIFSENLEDGEMYLLVPAIKWLCVCVCLRACVRERACVVLVDSDFVICRPTFIWCPCLCREILEWMSCWTGSTLLDLIPTCQLW